MKKYIFVLLISFFGTQAQVNDLHLILDKSKLGATCNLNGALEIWMHSGVCISDEANCNTFNASPWENMAPVNWGMGSGYESFTFVDSTGGFYYLTIDSLSETYGVSSPIYSMGLIFRDATGTLLGQDSNCEDIIITDIQNENPQVFQNNGALFDGLIATNSLAMDREQQLNVISVYPNPFDDVFSITFSFNYMNKTYEGANIDISLFSVMGQKLETIYKGNLNAGFHKIDWNNLKYNSGIYLIVLSADAFTKTIKVVKK